MDYDVVHHDRWQLFNVFIIYKVVKRRSVASDSCLCFEICQGNQGGVKFIEINQILMKTENINLLGENINGRPKTRRFY